MFVTTAKHIVVLVNDTPCNMTCVCVCEIKCNLHMFQWHGGWLNTRYLNFPSLKLTSTATFYLRSFWKTFFVFYYSNKLTNQMQQFYKFITWRFVSLNMFRGASTPIIRSLQLH